MTAKLLATTLLATAFAGLIPTAAQAAYEVSVTSTSGAGHAGPTICTYNHSGTGCSSMVDGTSGTVTPVDGTSATKATATTFQTGLSYGQTLPETTSATISADLSTGGLQMSSFNINGSPSSSYGSGGFAEISDVLHFTVAGAAADTITPVTVTFSIAGTMVSPDDAAPNTGIGEFYGTMVFGASDAQFYFLNSAATGYATTGSFNTYPSGYPGTWTYAPDYSEAFYTETYNLVGASSDIAVDAYANLNCFNGSSCQYDTAKFGITTGTGISFTSDSGVFLSAGIPGAVPESSTWAMMIGGLLMVGGTMRRRKLDLSFA